MSPVPAVTTQCDREAVAVLKITVDHRSISVQKIIGAEI